MRVMAKGRRGDYRSVVARFPVIAARPSDIRDARLGGWLDNCRLSLRESTDFRGREGDCPGSLFPAGSLEPSWEYSMS
jgi:hypothetical protein